MLDYCATTKTYYAKWLDCDDQDFIGGIRYICSSRRDVIQTGYSSLYALYICKTNTAVIVSYSSKIQRQVNQMKKDFLTAKRFDSSLDDYLNNLFAVKSEHHTKFVFDRQISYSNENVVLLSKDDYHLFLDFTISLGRTEWNGMREYFEQISDSGYCMARMVDGRVVSITDAPHMPFMLDMVQEIGINTLPGYHNRGYAREVVSACISKIISDDKCPQWSCDADNHASKRLAYSVGFKKFCDVYSIVL